MTTDTTEVSQEEVVTTEQEDADFTAGFNKVHGIEPSTETPETPATTETVETPEEPAAQEEPRVFGMTEAELKAQLNKGAAWEAQVRNAFGKIGEVNSAIQRIERALAAGKSGRKITPEMLAKVNAELPGLGTALAEDLSTILGAAEAAEVKAEAQAQAQGQAFDPKAFFEQQVAPAIAEAQARAVEAAQTELLESLQPDYVKTVNTPEFQKWLGKQTPERQAEIKDSTRAVVASKAIAEFKDVQAKAKQNKARLEGAITPKGGAPAQSRQTQDEEADFAAGFKKARNR